MSIETFDNIVETIRARILEMIALLSKLVNFISNCREEISCQMMKIHQSGMLFTSLSEMKQTH